MLHMNKLEHFKLETSDLTSMATSQPSFPMYSDEGELNQACRDLLVTLPRETGWVSSDLYKYQGFWYISRHLQGVVSSQKHFQAHDITTPKSGTTWFKALLFALVNRARYNPSFVENHPLLLNNPHVLVPYLEMNLNYDDHGPDLSSFASPRLLSTHMPICSLPESVKDSSCKVVYLCRNPKDSFVSLWYFLHKRRPPTATMVNATFEEAFDKFCMGLSQYGPFWDHVLGYWTESLRSPEKVLFLKYEDMKEKPSLYLKRMADFIGCPISVKEEKNGLVEDILQLCSFDKLSKMEVNKHGKLPSGVENRSLFRRGVVGDWKNHLTPEMVQRLDQISKEKLCGSGLNF